MMFLSRVSFAILLLCVSGYIAPAYAVITSNTIRTLEFGLIQAPSSGTVSVTIDDRGRVSSSTAQIIEDRALQGRVAVQSTDDTRPLITIDIQNVQTPPGVTLDNFIVRYRSNILTSFPATGQRTLGRAGNSRNINIGARMTIAPNAPDGNITMQYNLIVIEE